MTARPQRCELVLRGQRLSYVDTRTPSTNPVLLVHGWTTDSTVWDDLLGHLPADRRVLAVDLRGHGFSAESGTGYAPRTLAADVAALLDELGTGPVLACGHSLGGNVVSHLAVERPELVSSLIVLDPAYGRPEGHEAVVESWVAELRDHPETGLAQSLPFGQPYNPAAAERMDQIRERARSTPHEVVWRTLRDIHLTPDSLSIRPRSDEYLRRRRQPVLVINRDPRRAEWEDSVLVHPLSRALSWTETGHYPQVEFPEALAAVVREWTDLVDGRTTGFSFDDRRVTGR
jgi:pimeloyl-ACP methyl ester carboxylesterase